MNRLPPPDPDEQIKQRQAEIQRRIQAIAEHAANLYDLMEPGMAIQVSLEEMPAIITPNAGPPKVKRLWITRPMMYLEVKV